jgi:oxygen-dependent protoporphyrinogen oxidase
MMVSMRVNDVVVVGGGISGLVTAWRLKRAGADVCLLESDDQLGGCMRTEHRDGFILEKGPFNVLVRDEAFRKLLTECADEIEPVIASEESGARFLYKAGQLHAVPMGPGALLKSPLLSGPAKLRMFRGMLLSRRAGADEPTIAQAAERRLGAEVADTFISSIVAGVFGGDSRDLSLKACFPKAWEFDRRCSSPLLYEMSVLRRKKREARANPEIARYKGLISFREGLQALPDWLGRQIGAGLRVGRRVEAIDRVDGGFSLRCRNRETGGEESLAARRVVLATPAKVTAALLRPMRPAASPVLESIESASLVVLNVAYRDADVGHPMQGYGFLVPASDRSMPVMGVLWADSAFPHHGTPGRRLMRVFMGGPRDPNAIDRSDEELAEIATTALRGPLSLSGEPTMIDVCRWREAIPQYHVGHSGKVQRLDEELQGVPGLHLIGSYLRGVSINDCVRDAAALGDRLITRESDRSEIASLDVAPI